MALTFHNADHPFRCPQKKLHRHWLHGVISAHNKKLGEVAIVFCTDEYLLAVNKKHLDHDFYTDIITFDYSEGLLVSGDLLLSVDRIRENAKTHKSLFYNELRRVMVHGVLHMLGNSDRTDSEKTAMRHAEERWLRSFNPSPV